MARLTWPGKFQFWEYDRWSRPYLYPELNKKHSMVNGKFRTFWSISWGKWSVFGEVFREYDE